MVRIGVGIVARLWSISVCVGRQTPSGTWGESLCQRGFERSANSLEMSIGVPLSNMLCWLDLIPLCDIHQDGQGTEILG